MADHIIRSDLLAGLLKGIAGPEADGRGFSFPLPFGLQGPIVATNDAPDWVIDHERRHIQAGMDTQKNQMNDMLQVLKPPAPNMPNPATALSPDVASYRQAMLDALKGR